MLGAALALFRLAERPIWYDESVSLRLATVSWERFSTRALGGDQSFGGFYYSLLQAWTTIGEDPFTIRLLSVIFAVATIPLVYLLARRMFNGRVAVIASALLAINPYFVRYAQEARAYALTLFLVTLASYLLLRAIERPGTGRWLGYWLAAIAAVFAHLFALFVLLVHVALLAQQRHLSRRVAGAMTVGAIAVAPLVALVVLGGPERSFIAPITPARVVRSIHHLAGGFGVWLPVHGVVYTLVAALAVVRWRPRDPALFCLAWLLVPIALAALISIGRPILVVRYLIVALPAFMLLVAIGVDTLRPRWLARSGWSACWWRCPRMACTGGTWNERPTCHRCRQGR